MEPYEQERAEQAGWSPYDWEIEECTLAEELEDVARHYAAGATTPPSPPAFDTREEERMDEPD